MWSKTMFSIKSFKIVSKIVKLKPQELNIKDFTISFNEMYRDYVIYFPGHIDWYITRIGDLDAGFGPRYLLKKILEQVEKANPDGTIDSGSVEVRTIPELPEPLIRRLGQNSSLNPTKTNEYEKAVMQTDTSVIEEAEDTMNETSLGDQTNVNDDFGDPDRRNPNTL
jgi:hypothetical protein